MSFVCAVPGSPMWEEGRTIATNLLGYELPTSGSPSRGFRRRSDLWVLQGPGENWDDVSEEFRTRPIQAVVTCTMSELGPEVSIAVQPAHRGHGLATRLLRWQFVNQYSSFMARVATNQREGLAFAAKHGSFESYDGSTMVFHFDLSNPRLPHLGCSCSACYGDLDFANNRRS